MIKYECFDLPKTVYFTIHLFLKSYYSGQTGKKLYLERNFFNHKISQIKPLNVKPLFFVDSLTFILVIDIEKSVLIL